MDPLEKLEINQCRTCYNATKGLKLLTELTKCAGNQQISFSEILCDVTNINIMEDFYNELPQFICEGCSRKLKAAQAFIQQTHEVNERLQALLSRQKEALDNPLNCLEEPPGQVKMEVDYQGQCHVEVKNEPEIEDLPQEYHGIRTSKKIDGDENAVMEIVTEKDLSESKLDNSLTIKSEDSYYNEDNTDDDHSYEKNRKNENTSRKLKKPKEIVEKTTEDDNVAVLCNQCDKVFENFKALTRHLNTSHIPEHQKLSCTVCFRKFTQTSSMYTHMRTFHGADSVPLIRKPLTEERTFQCSKCPKNYTKIKYLHVHMKTKHSQEDKKNEDKSTEQGSDETRPAKLSNRPLCSVCGKSFPNKTHLTIHMRRHTGERPFKCDNCDRAFPRLVELTYHRRIHTGEKPFVCKKCGKAFRVSKKLNSHMISHTDERPYKCTECARDFKYSKDLNIHFRIHTGERPYSCNVCGNTFVQSNSLKAHRVKFGHMENVQEKLNDLVC